jgi:hypothetical protein
MTRKKQRPTTPLATETKTIWSDVSRKQHDSWDNRPPAASSVLREGYKALDPQTFLDQTKHREAAMNSRPDSLDEVSQSKLFRETQKEHEFVKLSRWWVLETGEVYKETREGQGKDHLETEEYEEASVSVEVGAVRARLLIPLHFAGNKANKTSFPRASSILQVSDSMGSDDHAPARRELHHGKTPVRQTQIRKQQ